MKNGIILFFLFIGSNAFAQTKSIDSLKAQLPNATDSIKGAVLREIIIQSFRVNPDSGLAYVNKLKEHAISKNDSSRLIDSKSLESEYYWRKGEYKTAMTHAMNALSMAESSSKFFSKRGAIYQTLGNIHLYLLNADQAIAHYKLALLNFEKQPSSKAYNTASIMNNIGVVYMDAAESRKDSTLLDSAEVYFLKALKFKDQAKPGTRLNASGNLGLIYLQKHKFNSSLGIFREWELLESQYPSATAKAMHLGNIGRLHLALGDENKAIGYLLKGLTAAKEIDAQHEMQEYYGNLASAYARRKDYKNAYEFSSLYMVMRDSVFNTEKANAVSELETKYQTEKKEQQIKDLEQQNIIKDLEATTARQWRIGLIIILGLLTAVAVALFNRYQLKQRTAKSLDEKNSDLQKLNGFKDRMFAVISHDLRNPVDAFNTIIESLNQNLQYASREELKEFLESTLTSAKDLKSLLNNLLEWSLVQIGKLPVNPKSVSIKEIVDESISHVDGMASEKGTLIKSSIDKERIFVDKNMMTIIVRNLLSNAIKFSPAGKSVYLDVERKNGNIILSVQDEGIGMSTDDVVKLFRQDVNVRSIGSSTAKGTGIGLLLCKELAERSNGRIHVQSEEGKGSTFYLELPTA
jgi:signal transduction histidine kinase